MAFIASLLLTYRYWILFPIAFFEGPITSFLVGTFVALGYFNPIYAYPILVLGDVVPDWLYYLVGRYGDRKSHLTNAAAKLGIAPDHFDAIRTLWAAHGAKTMFISKLAYGLTTPLLISAGISGMPPGRYLRYTLWMTLVQHALLMFLGYYFGNSLGLVTNVVGKVGIVAAGAVVVGVGYYFLMRYMRNQVKLGE